jgi:hemerythrin superfamily protein
MNPTTAAKSATADSPPADAVDLLTADHQKVESLFQEFSELDSSGAPIKAKAEVVREICSELAIHEQVENEVFFPAVRDVLRKEDVFKDAIIEQNDACEVVSELAELNPRDPFYSYRVRELGEEIKEHAEDEEIEFFPVVQAAAIDTRTLGTAVQARKEELEQHPNTNGSGESDRTGEAAEYRPQSEVVADR